MISNISDTLIQRDKASRLRYYMMIMMVVIIVTTMMIMMIAISAQKVGQLVERIALAAF